MRKQGLARNICKLVILAGNIVVICRLIRKTISLKKMLESERQMLDKVSDYYAVLYYWLQIKQKGKSLVTYFEREHIKTIAIYGMKELGECLYNELLDSKIIVKYAIDKSANQIYSPIKLIEPDGVWEEVDVIVVTAFFHYEQIKEEIQRKINVKVVNLQDIIFSIV